MVLRNTNPSPHFASLLKPQRPVADALAGLFQIRRTGLPVLAWVAPHEDEPAQRAPSTSMKVPFGIWIVVPALIINVAPPATFTSPVRECEPVHVSVPVISPAVVSFVAAIALGAAGISTTKVLKIISITKLRLFAVRIYFPMWPDRGREYKHALYWIELIISYLLNNINNNII